MTTTQPPAGLTAAEQIDSRPLTRNQKSIIGLVVVGNIAEFFDIFLIGFVVSLLVKPWNLNGFETGTILACAGLGTVAGAIVWGRLSDKLGRRGSFFWCIVVLVVFTALCVVTPDRGWWMLAILRVGVGMGVGGLNITSIPYVQEFVPAKHRGLLAGLASVFIPFGLLLGAQAQQWLAEPLGWRGLIGLGILPVFLLIWLRYVPESPRFLQVNGREDEARRAYAWALMVPENEVGALPEIKDEKKASYGLLFREHLKPLTIITIGSFCFILGSFTIQSWGQTLLKDGYGYSVASVGLLFTFVSIADMVGRLGSAWLSDYIGRRMVMLSFGLIGAVGCVIAGMSTSGEMFFAGILIAMMFGDGAFGILNAFGAEQFPNEVRSTGLGLGYGIGATAKIIGPVLMGALIGGSAVKAKPTLDAVPPAFFLFAALLAMGGITYLFAKETRAVQLEKI
ncbi:MFS transporter [Dermabacteraceae bacterium P13115]|nr:MFS transporter [Dermabacteraceae bacterium TAE3-ERU5]